MGWRSDRDEYFKEGTDTLLEVKESFGSDNTAASHLLVAGVAAHRIRPVRFILSSQGRTLIKWESDPTGTPTQISLSVKLFDAGSWTWGEARYTKFVDAISGEDLGINLTKAVTVEWHIWYVEVPD